MGEPIRYRHRATRSVATLRLTGRNGCLVGFTEGIPARAYGSVEAAERALRRDGYFRDTEQRARPVNLQVALRLAIEAPPEVAPAAVLSADAQELRRLRLSADLSQTAVAELLGVTLRTLQRLEAGEGIVRSAYVHALRSAVEAGGRAASLPRKYDALRKATERGS